MARRIRGHERSAPPQGRFDLTCTPVRDGGHVAGVLASLAEAADSAPPGRSLHDHAAFLLHRGRDGPARRKTLMPDMAPTPRPQPFQGRRVLVVEDEYIIAEDLREELEREGALVLGPVASVAAALDLLQGGPRPDTAILDINLRGERVFPVADRLRAMGVPFVFATGYDAEAIPRDYADVPRIEKPFTLRDLGRWGRARGCGPGLSGSPCAR
ncbi:response regulator [Paracoccus shandongensis]|uniref:response regulator n=1 Tax=Paracoccus shandongensis TaxID=2816048 RepID=UPI001A8E7AFC|nr:response regulator [Paracoccus shandongensis]